MGKRVIQIPITNINYTTKWNSIQFNTFQYNARHLNNVQCDGFYKRSCT